MIHVEFMQCPTKVFVHSHVTDAQFNLIDFVIKFVSSTGTPMVTMKCLANEIR